MTEGALLSVRGLRKSFGGVRAVEDVSFDLQPGELLAMIGPNGAGKSTCFNLVNGQLRPDTGSVRFEGREIAGLAPRAIWRLGVGRTFQVASTYGSMTVAENVQMALLSHRRLWSRCFRTDHAAAAPPMPCCRGPWRRARRACRRRSRGHG